MSKERKIVAGIVGFGYEGYSLDFFPSPAAAAGAPEIFEPMRAADINLEYIFEPPDCETRTRRPDV